MKDSKRRVVEREEEKLEELNVKFKSVVIVDTTAQSWRDGKRESLWKM